MQAFVFEQRSIPKLYLRFSLPVVFSMVVSIVYNVADTFFISQTQNTALVAAVSLCAPCFTTLMALGNIFGQGGNSLISRYMGQGNDDDIRRVSSFCLYAAITVGLVAGMALLALRVPVLRLFGATHQTMQYALDYYVVLSLGAPLCVLTFIHSNLLRSEGLAMESMVGTVGGAVINIVLDPIFISGLGLNATGAATATVIGYAFSDLYFLVVVHKRSRVLSLNVKDARVTMQQAGQVFAIGTSAALANLMQSVCMILMNQFLLPYGNDKIAAMGIVLKVSMIVLLVVTGFSFGGAPLMGYYIGAKDGRRLRQLLRFATILLCSLALLMSLTLIVLAPAAMQVFLKDPGVVRDGALMLRLQVLGMVCAAVVLLVTNLFQAAGKPVESLLLSVSRQGVVFLAVILVVQHVAGYVGILAAQPIADLLSAALAGILYFLRFRTREADGLRRRDIASSAVGCTPTPSAE